MSEEVLAKAPFSPPDVSWVKYSGSVPEGAIVFGSDEGQNVYAGRVYYENELLVGTAFLQAGCCVFSRNSLVHKSSDFEVLCVPVGEPLEWVKVDPTTSVQRRPLLKAGRMNNGQVLYIGRIVEDGKSYIGWADVEKKLAYIPRKGMEAVCNEFEILIHKYLEFLCICPPCPLECRRELPLAD